MLYRSIPLRDIAKAEGNYAVGTQNIYVIDSTRAMWFTDGIKGPRELSVKGWYPADDEQLAEKASYVENQELLSEALSKR